MSTIAPGSLPDQRDRRPGAGPSSDLSPRLEEDTRESGPRPPRYRNVKGRSSRRRWCLPPAILREPDETMEGAHIFEEHRGEIAGALWAAFRGVTLWASVPPERREGLFTPTAVMKRMDLLRDCGADPALEVHLTALASVADNPGAADPGGISAVCAAVAQWAADQGAMGTAVAFAQAGALALPGDASAALAVGRLAARWGRGARAETWLRRAIGLARRSGDWQSYAESYVELGAVYRRSRRAEQSHRYYVQAVRAARRHGHLQIRGAALHELFLLHLEKGDLVEAERMGRLAVRAYGRSHRRLPELQHDIAQLWVAKGNYGRALPMLQRLLSNRHPPGARAFTLALIAHAAAATGDGRLYDQAWSNAWKLLDNFDANEATPRTLLELARAAARLHDWLRVTLASQRQAIAQVRGERDPNFTEEIARLAALALREPGTPAQPEIP